MRKYKASQNKVNSVRGVRKAAKHWREWSTGGRRERHMHLCFCTSNSQQILESYDFRLVFFHTSIQVQD